MDRSRKAWLVAGVVGVLWLALAVSGKGVLLSQRLVHPKEPYFVPRFGDVGKAQQSQLICRYFVGTRVRWEVFWYDPSGFMGRADCPFFIDR